MKSYVAIEQFESPNEKAVGSFARENKWEFTAESREDAQRQVNAMNMKGHAITHLFTAEEYYAPSPVREKSEWETLKLRGNDRIEGDEVVLGFKRGREVRMSKTEWTAICDRSREPHTIAATRLA